MQMSESRQTTLRQWLPVAVVFYLNGGVYGAWATQIPIAKARLNVTEATFGGLLVMMGIGAIVAMVLTGRLLPRVGAERLIGFGFGLFVLSLLGLSVADSPLPFCIALLIFGASGGMMDVAMNAHAAAVETEIGRPVMSSFHGMWNVGGLAGSIGGGILLVYLSGPAQALVLSIGFLVPFMLIGPRLRSKGPRSSPGRMRSAFGGWHARLIGALTAISFSAEGSVRDWGSLYLNGEFHVPLAQASWGYAVFSALMAVGRFAGDRVRFLLGDRWTVVGSGSVACLGFLVAAIAARDAAALLGFGLVGLGLSNVVPVFISAAGRLPNPSTSITIVVAMGYAGFLASPPVLGCVAAITSLAHMFFFVGIASFLVVFFWFAVRQQDRDEA